MKQPTLLKRTILWRSIALLIITLITVFLSCRKDHSSTASSDQNNINIASLKSAYSVGINANASQLKSAAYGALPQLNLIHSVIVNWSSYSLTRRNDGSKVIEFNVIDTSHTFMQDLQIGQQIKYNDKTAVVFVERNDTIVTSFFMKVVEDMRATGYKSVISQLHYGKVPTGYDGTVMFYTLDKTYLNGYRYTNGKITADVSVVIPVNNSGQQIQSTGKQTDVLDEPTCTETDYYLESCDWGGPASNPYEFFNGCEDYYEGSTIECTDPGSSSGGAAGDNGGGSSDPPAPPPPCDPPITQEAIIAGGKRVIMQLPGGGSGSGTPCVPNVTDPCAIAKAIKTNADYNSKLTDLNSHTNGDIEYGWFDTQNADGTYTYKSATSTPSDPDHIIFDFTALLSNMMHNHFVGQNTTFDGGDVNAMYAVYNAGKVANINTFNSTVVTPSGTYMLVVSDIAKFTASAPNSSADIDDLALQVYGYYTLSKLPQPNAAQEFALAKFLSASDTGLTLLKLNADGTFTVLSYDSITNKLTIINCN